MSELLISFLILLNLFQFIFWSYQVQKMINKLMSKNYAEYDLVKSGPPPVEIKPENPFSAHEEQAILDELNGLIKPVDRT